MTDPELQGIAAQAFNMAKLDLERGPFNFLLASYYAGEGVHRMRLVEELNFCDQSEFGGRMKMFGEENGR